MNELTSSIASRAGANPMRPPARIATRYAIFAAIIALVAAMTYHIFIHDTDWGRTGGPAGLIKEVGRFVPDLGFLPEVIGPLLETLLMAFWGK